MRTFAIQSYAMGLPSLPHEAGPKKADIRGPERGDQQRIED